MLNIFSSATGKLFFKCDYSLTEGDGRYLAKQDNANSEARNKYLIKSH